MFKYILIVACIALATALPRPDDDSHAETLVQKSDVRHDGFDAALETSNHIQEQRSGDEHGNIHGDFSWISKDGEHIHISYKADEHGYQPSGDVLPTPPPIPKEILQALEYIAAHPPKEEKHH